MSEPPKILYTVLTTYERQGWVHPSILDFVESLRQNNQYAVAYAKVHNFVPAASARNLWAKTLKDAGADWLLMIDNDMDVPGNLLDTVKDAPEDAAIVVPKFHLWDEALRTVKLCWGPTENDLVNIGSAGKYLVTPGFRELMKCGTGAIFIRPKVFRDTPYPYFEYVYNADGGMEGTEDIAFCKKAVASGHKIYGNGSITVGHWRSVNLASLARAFYERELDNAKELETKLQLEAARVPPSPPVAAECPS